MIFDIMAKKSATKNGIDKDATKKKSRKTSKYNTNPITPKKPKNHDESLGDMGIVIVDDDLEIDQEKINEERRAYLEEARSQEAVD